MTHEVIFAESASQDLREIYHWIADRADAGTAMAYIERIRQHGLSLANFPNRGTPRDDLESGMRTTVFETRVVIAYTVTANEVMILRILNHGRDAARAFSH